jgi:hypothetical protein
VLDQLTLSKNALRAFVKLYAGDDDNQELSEHITNILNALEKP